MATVCWILEGENAGKFVPLPPEEADRLIAEGKAQIARTPAHLIRRPRYQTRELRAEDDPSVFTPPAVVQEKPQPKKKRKPRKKKPTE